ncbi:MAG: Sec-independent protein translocase protein TatB [Actinomycetota bacterium]
MNLGSGEVLVILLVALLVLGPTRLPEAARQVGKAMRTIRQVSTGFQDEMRHAIEDTIEADAAKDAGVSYTPASRPGSSAQPTPPPDDDRPDPGGPTDLTTETADGEDATAVEDSAPAGEDVDPDVEDSAPAGENVDPDVTEEGEAPPADTDGGEAHQADPTDPRAQAGTDDDPMARSETTD